MDSFAERPTRLPSSMRSYQTRSAVVVIHRNLWHDGGQSTDLRYEDARLLVHPTIGCEEQSPPSSALKDNDYVAAGWNMLNRPGRAWLGRKTRSAGRQGPLSISPRSNDKLEIHRRFDGLPVVCSTKPGSQGARLDAEPRTNFARQARGSHVQTPAATKIAQVVTRQPAAKVARVFAAFAALRGRSLRGRFSPDETHHWGAGAPPQFGVIPSC